MKPEQDRVRHLLTDTVTLLCKNGLPFNEELKVEGVIGITLDNNDVFVVHINEAFGPGGGPKAPLQNTGVGSVGATSLSELPGLVAENHQRPRLTQQRGMSRGVRPRGRSVSSWRRGSFNARGGQLGRHMSNRARGSSNQINQNEDTAHNDEQINPLLELVKVEDKSDDSDATIPDVVVEVTPQQLISEVSNTNIQPNESLGILGNDNPAAEEDPKSITSCQKDTFSPADEDMSFFDPMNDNIDSSTLEPALKRPHLDSDVKIEPSPEGHLVETNGGSISNMSQPGTSQSNILPVTDLVAQSAFPMLQTGGPSEWHTPHVDSQDISVEWPMDDLQGTHAMGNIPPVAPSRPGTSEARGKAFPRHVALPKSSMKSPVTPTTGSPTRPSHPNVWRCPYCALTFTSKSKFTSHMSSQHDARAKIACTLCDKQFSSRASYNGHVRCVHEGRFKHVCQLCGRGFAGIGDLEGHLNKHRGIKPYVCDVCGASFTHKKNLGPHYARMHDVTGK